MPRGTGRPSSGEGGAPARGGAPAQGRALRARGQHTLRKLLDAGAQVFAERGFHAARVDDVVKRARTSHGTFYLYFSNKEDLFGALAREVAEAMRDHAERLGAVGGDGRRREEIATWIAGFCELYERSGPVIRAWTEAEISSSEFGRLGEDVLTDFTVALTERIRALEPPGIDPGVAALAIVAMLERMNYYVLTRQVRVDREAMVSTLSDVVHAVLSDR